MKFYKYQGAGNDFILIEDYSMKFFPGIEENIPTLCNRHYGIGADGVIVLHPSRIANCRMRIFNPDGKEAGMCGNGLRCAVKHLRKGRVSVETDAGISLGENKDGQVLVTLPVAKEILSPIALEGGEVGHLFDIGVPHLVIPTTSFEREDFKSYAKDLRYHKMFSPEGVNVSIICHSGGDIYVRTYERGVEAETLACGTACTASVLAIRKGENKKQSSYTVYPKSKNALHFTFDNKGRIWMIGPASLVFEGKVAVKKQKQKEMRFATKRG